LIDARGGVPVSSDCDSVAICASVLVRQTVVCDGFIAIQVSDSQDVTQN